MSKKIILHIGSPKCGSTYLQRVFLQNGPALAAARIAYPHTDPGHPGNAANLGAVTAEELERLFETSDTVVFSHEDLFSMPERGRALAPLVAAAGIDVYPVAFLRPYSEFMFGDYSQFLKQHFETYLKDRKPYGGASFEEFTTDRAQKLHAAKFITGWNTVFPGRQVQLGSHRDIRRTLEQLIDLPEMNWSVHRHITNPSLRMEDCDAVAAAMYDPALTDETIRGMFKQAFKNTDLPDAGKTAERIAFVESVFAPQNAALLEKFGYNNLLKKA
jgi:hypothetical protein